MIAGMLRAGILLSSVHAKPAISWTAGYRKLYA